jgi:hypothetical protein
MVALVRVPAQSLDAEVGPVQGPQAMATRLAFEKFASIVPVASGME